MNLSFKIIASIILTTSAISKLLFTEPFEFTLVENGIFSWTLSPIAVKGVIILEFLLGIALLVKSIHSKLISLSLFLLTFFYAIDYYSKPLNGLYNNDFILSLFNQWITIIGIAYLIFFSIVQINKNEINAFKRIKNVLINGCIVLIVSIPLFIFNPLFIDDFQQNNTAVNNPNLNWNGIFQKCEEANIQLEVKNSTLFAFLSTSCYYCNRSAKMLGISGRSNQTKPSIVLVFPGNKKDTEEFIERNKCDFPYIMISKDEFRKLAGNEYPAFFKVESKKETNYYTGETFNYRELDLLFN